MLEIRVDASSAKSMTRFLEAAPPVADFAGAGLEKCAVLHERRHGTIMGSNNWATTEILVGQ